MQLSILATILSLIGSTAAANDLNASALFSNVDSHISSIPSIYESTLQARRILHLSKIATLSTNFPSESSNENRPHDVAGAPIGLMEYFANCGPEVYNPTILGVTIATTMRNAAAGSNVTLSLRYHLPADAPPPPGGDDWAYLAANLPRFSLIGYLEKLDKSVIKNNSVRDCFIATHPEATIWEPGTDIHESWWGRLVVQEVYFFGGFGDRARISWLPIEMWRNITTEEVEKYRMVGEKGYKRDQSTLGQAFKENLDL